MKEMKNLLTFDALFESYLTGITDVTDHEILGTTLVLEAGAEGDAGMTAVLNVIKNRSEAKGTAKAGEALRPSQFSMWNTATKNISDKKDFGNTEVITEIKRIVAEGKKHPQYTNAVEIIKSDPADTTKGSNSYYAFKGSNKISAPSFTTNWTWKTDIGNHKFGHVKNI